MFWLKNDEPMILQIRLERFIGGRYAYSGVRRLSDFSNCGSSFL